MNTLLPDSWYIPVDDRDYYFWTESIGKLPVFIRMHHGLNNK
jgi:hypothetical protein